MNYSPDVSDDDRALDARQGADFLNVSVKTFRRLYWAGKLPPAIRVSDKKLNWRKGELRACQESRRVTAA